MVFYAFQKPLVETANFEQYKSVDLLKWTTTLIVLVGCADSPKEYVYSERLRCEENQGVCTSGVKEICGVGTQPLTTNDPDYTNCLGYCCIVPEDASTCDLEPNYNCLPDEGLGCPGIWKEVEGSVTCQDDRVCCFM